MLMKTTGLIVLGLSLAALAAPAQTNPAGLMYRNPVRVFGAHATANLTPLFQWWAQHPAATNDADFTPADLAPGTDASIEYDRPLAAWHRVTGLHAATVGGSWIVDAVIYTSPTSRTNCRIILNHPPVSEEQAYLALQGQLAQTVQQISDASAIYDDAVKAEEKDKDLAAARRRSWSKAAPASVATYRRLAAKKHQEAESAAFQKEQLEAARNRLEQQLEAFPATNGAYCVDWFALMQGRNKQGMPVYDPGQLVSGAP